ncbi:hypothetical protein CSUI_008036, partial [Cystoisospora suis]
MKKAHSNDSWRGSSEREEGPRCLSSRHKENSNHPCEFPLSLLLSLLCNSPFKSVSLNTC